MVVRQSTPCFGAGWGINRNVVFLFAEIAENRRNGEFALSGEMSLKLPQ
jgi:hypothetical protein